MNAEILSVGTELLLGEILNTNEKYLSQELAALGVDVFFRTTVGDNPNRLKEAVKTALSRADILIATGGLGPTQDDITKEVVAEALGCELEFHEDSYKRMLAYFKSTGRDMPESNKKQAMMPKGARVLENTCGTATGCIIEKDGKTAIILPGPPSEMTAMFEKSVRGFFGINAKIYEQNIRLFGIGESKAAEILDDLISKGGAVTVAPYALTGEVRLRIAAKSEDENEAKKQISDTLKIITERVGEYIYSLDNKNLPEVTVELLRKKKLTIAAAESCTGGMFAKMITDISGASEILGESYVTYAPEAKIRILGVKKETVEKYTVVSKECAKEMAEGVRKIANSDIGVSFTGFAGPGGDDVGTVFMAVSTADRTEVKKLKLNGDRDRIRYTACLNGFDTVRRMMRLYE